MSEGNPRCVYCSKPTRSHEVTIAPSSYAAAYEDRSFDADAGTYVAMVCHDCWVAHDAAALEELATAPGTGTRGDGGLSEAAREAVREMNHEHVRFDLAE